MIEIDDLEKIISIVEKHDVSYFEFEQESSRVVIEKNAGNITREDFNGNINKSIGKADDNSISHKSHESSIETSSEKDDECNKKVITSTLAGTFYLKKDENSEPFVKVGDTVKEDTIIGLVEVMKLFNEIEAGAEGEISKVLVNDGEFVEYGQPLFELI